VHKFSTQINLNITTFLEKKFNCNEFPHCEFLWVFEGFWTMIYCKICKIKNCDTHIVLEHFKNIFWVQLISICTVFNRLYELKIYSLEPMYTEFNTQVIFLAGRHFLKLVHSIP